MISGDRVYHADHGEGVAEQLLANGIVLVRFGHTTQMIPSKELLSDQEKRLRREQQRRETEAQRAELIRELRERLARNFLGADSFFTSKCGGILPRSEYEQETIAFVKAWVTKGYVR